jgi:hypothetical protein
VPCFIALNLLAFVGIGFVGKLTKPVKGYNKQAEIGALLNIYRDQ